MSGSCDVMVVGGGLAGLVAASNLGRAGRRVALFEQSHLLGGRAMTELKDGFHLNMGHTPRTRVNSGGRGWAGKRVLEDLGVVFHGHSLVVGHFAYGVNGERKGILPACLRRDRRDGRYERGPLPPGSRASQENTCKTSARTSRLRRKSTMPSSSVFWQPAAPVICPASSPC